MTSSGTSEEDFFDSEIDSPPSESDDEEDFMIDTDSGSDEEVFTPRSSSKSGRIIHPHPHPRKRENSEIDFGSVAIQKMIKIKKTRFDVEQLTAEPKPEYELVCGGLALEKTGIKIIEEEITDVVQFADPKFFENLCAIIEHKPTGFQTVYCLLHPPGPNPKAKAVWKSKLNQQLFPLNRSQLSRIYMSPLGFNRTVEQASLQERTNRYNYKGRWICFIPDLLFAASDYVSGSKMRKKPGPKPKRLSHTPPPTTKNHSGLPKPLLPSLSSSSSPLKNQSKSPSLLSKRKYPKPSIPSNNHSLPNSSTSSDESDQKRTGLFWCWKTMKESEKYAAMSDEYHSRIEEKWTDLYSVLIKDSHTFKEHKAAGFERLFGFLLLEEMQKVQSLYEAEVAQKSAKRQKTDSELLAELDF